MKKIAAALAAVLISLGAAADEGMWLLPLLQEMNADAMRNIGCRLTPEDIFSINNASIKDAVVQFGSGCTGEIISDRGLLVTNHHCGYGSIQRLSTPEHNYLEDGFWAMNLEEEIPVPGLTVKFLQNMTDVTDEFASVKNDKEAEKLTKALVKQAEEENPHCTAMVVSFYNGNARYLIIYKIYRDVRFVGAPPASMGKFGGETDNWMWPRHTCDFSMFRVYAGKDNEPADYSVENVPMVPRRSLKIALWGYEEGDFAMIMGYPGRTQRFQTASQLESMLATNQIKIDARTVRQDVLWKEMRSDDTVSLKYANKYAGSANGWKKWIGMKQSFAALDIIGREEAKEAELRAWIAADAGRTEKYGSAIDDIASCVKATDPALQSFTLLNETIGRIELLGLSASDSDDGAYRDYDPEVDRKVAKALVKHYLANVKPEDRIEVSEAYVDAMFDGSVFTTLAKKNAAGKLARNNDLATLLYKQYLVKARGFMKEARKSSEKLADASKAYAGALLEWQAGKPSYPDANLTCRLTYGTVKSYSPKDGVLYRHYTTLKGVMEKEDPGNYEFRVPAKLKELYKAGDYGQYANKEGGLTTCFLTNLDITGGNSGSPVLDADGNLIGLAFDGNWESMSSDVMFEPNLQRCICVDIRYVLFMMDKFGGAGYLLDEMTLVK